MDSLVVGHPHTSPITTAIIIHFVCTKFGDISCLEDWNSTLNPSKQHAPTWAHLDWLAWWARPACRRRAASAASHLDGRGAAWPRWTGGASALSARVSQGQAVIVAAVQQAKVPRRGRRGPRRSAASARRAAPRRLLRPFLLSLGGAGRAWPAPSETPSWRGSVVGTALWSSYGRQGCSPSLANAAPWWATRACVRVCCAQRSQATPAAPTRASSSPFAVMERRKTQENQNFMQYCCHFQIFNSKPNVVTKHFMPSPSDDTNS